VNILIPIKQVVDPDQYRQLQLAPDGTSVVTQGLALIPNPFDEHALEAALRLTEDGREPTRRLGEVVVVTLGSATTETMLRSALAIGAGEAIRVEASHENIDAWLVSKTIARLAKQSSVDLVLLGKQSADGDGNEVAQRVAALLDWPQVTGATQIEELEDGSLLVEREVDGGTLRVGVGLPAVISVDLRIIAAQSVRSRHCPREYLYPPGVRFATLPAIIAARRKPIVTRLLGDLVEKPRPVLRHVAYDLAPSRACCRIVGSTDELVQRLTSDSRVL
jgi:electron transfer flavoprotein beta subunit